MIAAAPSQPSSVTAAIIGAAAALAGVCVAQLVSWLQRRTEERRRHKQEIAAAIAPTLSLALEARDLILRGERSQTDWYREPSWATLRDQTWPTVRMLLLNQAAQQPRGEQPSFYDVALELQRLLNTDERNAERARQAWDRIGEDVLLLSERAAPDRRIQSVQAGRGAP